MSKEGNFLIFCIEQYKSAKNLNGEQVIDLFSKYKIFDYIPENTFYDFAKNVFPKLLLEKQINTFVIEDYWSDIGTLEQYKISTQDVFLGNCKFEHAKIVSTSTGSCITNSEIPEDTVFVGNSTIGKNCKIGKNVTVANSIIWDNVTIKDNVKISDCIIASNEVVDSDLTNKVVGCNKLITV